MAKFKLDFEIVNDDVQLQMDLDPPGEFKSVDDATDWALTNLPRGLHIVVMDGRGKMRASGPVGGKLSYYK